jgi:Flp pilus assembly protein TadG
MPSQLWKLKGRRDSGAVAVETAVVSTFLVILLFGICESSFLFKDWLSVSSAARAGARMGASEPLGSTFAQDAANQVTDSLSDLNPANLQAVWVYRTTAATGLPDSGSFASCTTCVQFTWNSATSSLTPSYSNWPSTSQDACAGDAARDSLGVYIKYRHTSPLGFFFNNMSINASTVMWIEPTTALICKPSS